MGIAVTGAAGFIGSNICKALLARGEDVWAFDIAAPTDPYRLEIWESCQARVEIDLTRWEPLFHRVDRVVHLAANMGGVGFFHKHDYYPYLDNSKITFRVLEAIERWKIERSFVASSACVYPTQIQMEEGNAPLLHEGLIETGYPDQMYGREKLMLLRLAERHPQDVRVGILHTVYGVGQECEGERMKFPTAAATKAIQARQTNRVEMWGNGKQLRSYLYIDDAVRKILAVLDGDYDGPVNIGYQGAVTCEEIQRICMMWAGSSWAQMEYNPAEPSGVLARDCDNTKFNSLYGDLQTVDYSEGFEKLINWLETRDAAH